MTPLEITLIVIAYLFVGWCFGGIVYREDSDFGAWYLWFVFIIWPCVFLIILLGFVIEQLETQEGFKHWLFRPWKKKDKQ